MALNFPQFPGATSAKLTDLEVDGTTLVVDETNNRLGIGTSSPSATLDVSGTTNTTSLKIGGSSVTSTANELNLLDGSTAGSVVASKAVIYSAAGKVTAGDLHFQPTSTSTSHITTAGSLRVRATDNMHIGDDLVDSIRLGRTNTSAAKIHLRSGSDTDLVVSDGKVGIGMDDPSDSLEIDGDIQLTPTAISTAHIKTTGSLKVRASGNIHIGDDGVDSIRLGRTNTSVVKVHLRSGTDTDLVVSGSKIGMGTETPKTKLTVEGAVTLKEQAAADADTAAYGQLWVKTATPNELYFTTDAGDDIQLTTGTSAAGGGGVTADDLNLILHTQVFGR